jgi:hypothetical protein
MVKAEKDKIISSFKGRLLNPLISDITRIMDITSGKSGPDNGGVNLTAMIIVLVAIETVSQFIIEEDLESFKVNAKEEYKKLPSNLKKMFIERTLPSGLFPPIQFIEKYFDSNFLEYTEIESNENLAKLIWKFRNAQAHSFYPFISMNESGTIRGRVNWVYCNPTSGRIGLSMNEIKELQRIKPQNIYGIEPGAGNTKWFAVSVQILFLHFILATERYLTKLEVDNAIFDIFFKNYLRLKDLYQFI